jgi:hypothetical protein
LVSGFAPADAEDVAFLRLKEPPPDGVRPLSRGSSLGAAGHPFQEFGLPSASPEERIWEDGHILEETLMQGRKVMPLKSLEVTPGFSWSPVFDSAAGWVVGMANAIAASDESTARIWPISTENLYNRRGSPQSCQQFSCRRMG